MGAYTTRAVTEEEYHDIVYYIENGYCEHRPNKQIAMAIKLEANLGCRINDIMNMTTDSIIKDGDTWKLNITEQKTGKARFFTVPKPVKALIDQWCYDNGISAHERLFTISAAAVWKALRQVREFLDLDNVSSHSLRKFQAGKLYEATGHDIEAVAEFLNHSSINTTRHYLRLTNPALEAAIEKTVSL